MFFKAGYPIDSAVLLTPVDPGYKAKGAASLFDGKSGGILNGQAERGWVTGKMISKAIFSSKSL
jgi:hypothetical protein